MSEKWVKCGVIVSIVMLIVVIIGIVIGLFNISISLPSAKIEKTVYTVYSLEEPISLEMLPALKISPLYYIELIVKPSTNVYYTDSLNFSINIIDKGKKTVGEPEFRIFIVDSVGNVRGVYPSQVANLMKSNSTNFLLINDDIEKEECKNAINFNFKMPLEDQKVIGDWKIIVYLFDKGNRMLVSYSVCEFKVVSSKTVLYGGFITIAASIAITIYWKKLKKLRSR